MHMDMHADVQYFNRNYAKWIAGLLFAIFSDIFKTISFYAFSNNNIMKPHLPLGNRY